MTTSSPKTIEIASGRMAWILRAFKAIVLVLVADAVPGGPLRLEHAKARPFLGGVGPGIKARHTIYIYIDCSRSAGIYIYIKFFF